MTTLEATVEIIKAVLNEPRQKTLIIEKKDIQDKFIQLIETVYKKLNELQSPESH
jgi:hemerythrin-like domain-containing protein